MGYYETCGLCDHLRGTKPPAKFWQSLKNAFVRVVNKATQREIARYDLTENCTDETAFIFGELTRSGQKTWTFKAVGRGFTGSLRKLCDLYGVNVLD